MLVVKDKNELQILFVMSSVPTNRPARGRGRRAVEERGNKLAAKDKVKLNFFFNNSTCIVICDHRPYF